MRHIEYARGILEHIEEVLEDTSMLQTDKDVARFKKKFEKILLSLWLLNADLEGISPKEAKAMFEADMEELDEDAGGS